MLSVCLAFSFFRRQFWLQVQDLQIVFVVPFPPWSALVRCGVMATVAGMCSLGCGRFPQWVSVGVPRLQATEVFLQCRFLRLHPARLGVRD
eukprot:2810933-Amphidinium_carterae.1